MPLGSVLSYLYEDIPLYRLHLKALGVPDPHSHVRWWAVKGYIKDRDGNIDIGVGRSIMAFEFVKIFNKSVDYVEPEPAQIRVGETIAKKLGLDEKAEFIRNSLLKPPTIRRIHEQAFLIDVLEHVKEDSESLIRINAILELGGVLVISAPTPNYPKYFGREFTEGIGHARDNYAYNMPYKLKLLVFLFLKLVYKLDSIGKGINGCGIVVKAVKIYELEPNTKQ